MGESGTYNVLILYSFMSLGGACPSCPSKFTKLKIDVPSRTVSSCHTAFSSDFETDRSGEEASSVSRVNEICYILKENFTEFKILYFIFRCKIFKGRRCKSQDFHGQQHTGLPSGPKRRWRGGHLQSRPWISQCYPSGGHAGARNTL